MSSRISGDLYVEGGLSAASITPTTGTVSNTSVAAGANISYAKLEHWIVIDGTLGHAIDATPVAREEIIYIAKNSGTVLNFGGLLNDTGTSTDISFILKKNGSSILSGNAQVENTDTNRVVQAATISGTSYSAGDVFSVELTVASSTGAEGPAFQFRAKEVGV